MSVNADQVAKVLREIEADADADGWDQPSRLFNLYRHPDDPFGLRLVAKRVPLTPEMEDMKPPYLAMRMIAQCLRGVKVPDWMKPWGLVGSAFCCEGWMLEIAADDSAAMAEADRVASRREIYQHPDRIEQRMVTGLTFDDAIVTVMRIRGKEPETWQAKEFEPEGNVVDCLREFTAAVLSLRPAAQFQ